MNETSKTFTFVGVAVAALAIGWFASRPNPPADDITEELGKQFFPDFVDEKRVAVSGAEIIDFDSTTDTKHDLKVARVDGEWEINPERQGYPEVNAERLAEVIGAVSDLKKLSVVSDDRSKHREFGVVDPANEAELKEGTEGVGKRVDILDDAKKALVKLIVGKSVDEKNKKLHYVRRPEQDRVYSTEIDATKLSSNFDDWVKPDLLGASGGDLRYAFIDDYGIDLEQVRKAPVVQGGVVMIQPAGLEQVARSKAVLEKKPVTKEGAATPTDDWQVADLQTYDKEAKAYKDRKLTADEELESFKLGELGRALGDIKIVDVVKKPKVLAEDLKLEKNFLTNPASPVRRDRDSLEDLIKFGFRPSQVRNSDEARLICFEGEMTAGFANGVEYALRFGDITGKSRTDSEAAQPDDAEKPTDGAAEGSNTAPNRYLFVTARFNENLIPKPKLTELPPETPATPPAAEEKKPAADEKKPEPAKPEEKKPAEEKPAAEAKATEEKPAAAEKTPTKVDADDAKPDEEKKDEGSCDQEPAADEKKADEAKADEAKADEKKNDEPKADDKKVDDAKPAMSADERKRIESENKSKQEKYEADVKAGREKAKELNDQFADWFYVVSDSTFQKINVDPLSLIRTKPVDAPKPGGPGVPNLPNAADLLPQTLQ